MRKLKCENCGKCYNFDVDDFCPRCGAFNQPNNKWGFDANGNVIRIDGINERNHTGSFVHKEVHRERVVRRAKGLDRDKILASRKISSQVAQAKYVKRGPSLGEARAAQERSSISLDAILEKAKPFLPPSIKF